MKTLSHILAISALAVLTSGFAIAGIQASAQTPLKTTRPAASHAPLAAPTKKPASPMGAVVGQRPTMATALTAKECKDLGGSVGQDSAGLCGGGDICWRTDASGDIRRVCINER